MRVPPFSIPQAKLISSTARISVQEVTYRETSTVKTTDPTMGLPGEGVPTFLFDHGREYYSRNYDRGCGRKMYSKKK